MSTLKIGDKVKIAKATKSWHRWIRRMDTYVGTYGEIVEKDDCPSVYYVKLDNPTDQWDRFYFKEESLELVVDEDHPHAENMMEYAQDALRNKEPWRLWEGQGVDQNSDGWFPLHTHPEWRFEMKYRRKVIEETTKFGKYDIPKCMTQAPKVGTKYFIIKGSAVKLVVWCDDTRDRNWLEQGMCFSSQEKVDKVFEAIGKTLKDIKDGV